MKQANMNVLQHYKKEVLEMSYLEFDEEKLEGKMTRLPQREEMPAEIQEAYVVEFYNR